MVDFNPSQIFTSLDWSLGSFLHEIELHLLNNTQGKVRTIQHQDHKEAFLYDELSEKNKQIIDQGDSPNPAELPKESKGYKLYELILEQINKNK